MIVLGIAMGEFASAALLRDGKLLGSSYEERFHRRKCYSGYPKKTIEYLLTENNIQPPKINKIMVMNQTQCGLEYAVVQRLSSFSIEDYVREAHEYYKPILFEGKDVKLLDVFRDKIQKDVFDNDIVEKLISEGETNENSKELRRTIIERHLGKNNTPIKFVEHHLSHAIYGYLYAPIGTKDALVFSADSFGDYSNSNVYRFKDGHIKVLHSGNTHNLGRLFRNITLAMGMKPYQHEYKVMGLAPYAAEKESKKAQRVFDSFLTGFNKGEWKFNAQPKDHYFTFKKLLEGLRFDSIAGGLQAHFEERLKEWFTFYIEENDDCDTVIFTGGLSMNVKANMLLAEIANKNEMQFFAAPSGDDFSHCISVAFSALMPNENSLGQINPGTLSRLDLGYDFSKDDRRDITEMAEKGGWEILPLNLKLLAKFLGEGKILALCHGKAEFGARALGFRSIIADPRDLDTIRRINMTVKMRDFWMPFAPAILEGYENQYIESLSLNHTYRFMSCAAKTTKDGQSELRAATHPYDHTARPQIVSKEANEFFHDIIEAFGKHTGTFALLNTSLNIHGFPIVNNSSDLKYLMQNCNIDGCVLVDKIIMRTT